MNLTEFRFKNDNIELHGFTNSDAKSSNEPPIVFIPGLWGEAEQFQQILEALKPRKAYAFSLRGRGRSDIPEQGYSLEDHVSDIRAFVKNMNLQPFFLASVSAGASYAIAYAAEESAKLAGLILTDYPALMKSYPPEMVRGVLSSVQNMKISEKFLLGLQRESIARDLSGELKKISCPVSIFRGAQKGTYLSDQAIDVYKQNLKKFSFRVLSEVAHDPLEAPNNYVEALLATIHN